MSARGRSVLLLGATGLVGRECLHQLIADSTVGQINVALRRRVDLAPSPKVFAEVVDFDSLASRPELFSVDQIFCALGTTIKQAGSQAAFRKVDHDYPLAAAKIGLERGAKDFLLVSALGASAGSRVFYNRVKGELEDALRVLGYRSVTIVRPSLLVGDREQFRLGEEIGKRLGWILPGKYKPVAATAVARALVEAARAEEPGLHIIESDQIRLPSSSHSPP